MKLNSLFYWHKRKKTQTYKPVVLITGCASGIGLALARILFNHDQYRVVITARAKSLQGLKDKFIEQERFLIRELDVTKAESREKLVQEICEKWGRVDILINNAGISFRAVTEHMSDTDEILQMNTNYIGPMALSRLVMTGMREIGRGKIINVSSVSGMLAMPTMGSYSASKYALEGASEALWYEMRPFGVDVCLIQPGFINSDSFKHVYYARKAMREQLNGGPYEDFYENMPPFIEKLMSRAISTPESVAKVVLDTIQTSRPPLWIPATIDAEFFYYLRRLFPRRLLLPFLYFCLPKASSWAKHYSQRRL